MYYGTIYVIAILALLTQAFPVLQRLFFYRPRRFFFNISIGELGLFLTIVSLIIGQFCYFYIDHGWDLSAISSRTAAERTARALGQVANLGKPFVCYSNEYLFLDFNHSSHGLVSSSCQSEFSMESCLWCVLGINDDLSQISWRNIHIHHIGAHAFMVGCF